jgi:two-component system, NtrC family, response regulator AtoC
MATILVVDDEEGIREYLAEALSGVGNTVVQAADGMEALGEMAKRSFDVLITDLRMPGALDGIDLLRKARAESPETEVIVLTAFGSVGSAVEAMKLGAFDYLQKPVASPAELRLLVGRALERRRLLALKDQSRREVESVPPLTFGDPVMTPVVRAVERVAPTNATVLLLGESGTGKEVAARTLHGLSNHRDGPFIPVNCAAISETLMESEIFGHEAGSFTGATGARRGRLELADGGTLFLDEIGELKPELQAKLLRVLQERKFERLGGTRTIQVDVRWIAASNRELTAMVREGTFREDLYHRLAVFPVTLPPLRERKEDILPLAESLLVRICGELGRSPLRLDDSVGAWLRTRRWPGNVRELANVLERAAILAEGERLSARDLAFLAGGPGYGTGDGPPGLDDGGPRTEDGGPRTEAGGPRTMAQVEETAIREALEAAGGHRRKAAEALGIGERTLYEKLKQYGIR